MRKNIERLIKSGITAHRVALETKTPRNTAYRIFSGEAKIDNITLKNAEILNEYYIKNKEMLKMKKTFELIDNYFAVYSKEKYVTFYESKEDIAEQMDLEVFEEEFGVNADELSYPIITFEGTNSIDGYVYESNQADKALSEAYDFFEGHPFTNSIDFDENSREIIIPLSNYSWLSETRIPMEIFEKVVSFYNLNDNAKKVVDYFSSEVEKILIEKEDENSLEEVFEEMLDFAKEDYYDADSYESISLKANFKVDGNDIYVTI